MPPIKKIVLWLLVIFIAYSIITSPSDAADIFQSAWDLITNGIGNVAEFFNDLLAGQ
ncbi:MAG: hypothetical protein ACRCYX_06100 [Dermatophilaceae bacterium]